MTSDAVSYLKKLEEIQNGTTTQDTIFNQTPDEDKFIINADTREISVPSSFSNIGVIYDHNAETIFFKIPRYFDNVDLNDHTCIIQYINAGREEDIYTVTQKDLSNEGEIIFGWKITNSVTKYFGSVSFAVRFYSITNGIFDYNFNTKVAQFNVLNGLNVTANDIDVNPDLLSQWIEKINALDNIKLPMRISELIDDGNFAHKTGDETISGNKTFTENVVAPNLVQKSDFDSTVSDINTQLAQINTNKANEIKVNNIQSQINTIVLNGTSGDSSAELAQAKVDIFGGKYETLKMHTDNIENAIFDNKYHIKPVNSDYAIGIISSTTGIKGSSGNRICTTVFLPCLENKKLFISPLSGYQYNIAFYSSANESSFIKGYTFSALGSYYTFTNEKYYRISIAKSDNSVFNINDIPTINSALQHYYVINENTLDSLANDIYSITEEITKSVIIENYQTDNIISISASNASNDANLMRVFNRNIIPYDMEFFNNNLGGFNGSHNNPTNRVRTSSFTIPYGLYIYTLSGMENDIQLLSVRTYDKNKTPISGASTIIAVKKNLYQLKLTKNVMYIHLLFKKSDDSVFQFSEVQSLNLMLEYGTVIHDYVAGVRVNTPITFGLEITDLSNFIINNDYTILAASNGDIDFKVKRKNTSFDEIKIIKEIVNDSIKKQDMHKLSTYYSSKYKKDIAISNLFEYKYVELNGEFNNFNINTTSEEYFNELNTLVSGSNDYITVTNCGKDASGNHDIFKYSFISKNISSPNVLSKNPKLLIIGAQHGYEKGGAFAIYYLIRELLNNWIYNPILEFLKYECDLVIMPIVNPWGFNHAVIGTENGYGNVNNVNLNRNYYNGHTPSSFSGIEPFTEIETRYVKDMILENSDAMYFMDFHTNGTTRTSSNYKYNNWISLKNNGDQLINEASKRHVLNITRHICKSRNIAYNDLGYISASEAAGMAKDYADYCGISSCSFEGTHRFPYTEVTEFTESTNKFNTEILINWLGCIIGEYKKYYDILA